MFCLNVLNPKMMTIGKMCKSASEKQKVLMFISVVMLMVLAFINTKQN